MPSLFLSHTSADKDRARAICHDLKGRGIDVWFDEAEIAPGDTLLSRIEPAIGAVDCLAVILSPASVSAPWVLDELKYAAWTHRLGGRVRVVPMLISDCDLPDFLKGELYLDLRADQDAQLVALTDFLLGRSADIPIPLQLQLDRLVTAAGPGRWSYWSADRLDRSRLVSVLRSMSREELEIAVEVAHCMPPRGDRSQKELLAMAAARLPGGQAKARAIVRRLVEAGLVEASPALGRDDEESFASGVLARALLGVAQRSGAFSTRLPPPEPERLSELLAWRHHGQRSAWSLSGPQWSAWCLGGPEPLPPREEKQIFALGGMRITGTVKVPSRPIDTIIWSEQLDRTWVFASPEDFEPAVWTGRQSGAELGLQPYAPRLPLTAHYPEIDFTTFDDLDLLHTISDEAVD